jgi:predicted TIM-barrel fold metal-dependent hydrolase
MADVYARSRGRLPWIAVLPLLCLDRAVDELRIARQHGACGVFMRCAEPGNRRVESPYFFPLYDEAQRLDVPICVHSANGSPELTSLFADDSGFARFKLAGVGAFHALLFQRVPERFPSLRFAFVELSAQWVPYALHDLRRRRLSFGLPAPSPSLLRDNRVYVACQTDDDLPYVIGYTGDENLVMGTDYGHADTSSELEALRRLKDDGKIEPQVVDKILDDNPRALYGL